MANITKNEQLKGLRLREQQLNKKWQNLYNTKGSKDEETERYDAFYSCYGVLADCFEAPHKNRFPQVAKYISSVKQFMKEEDLEELRKIYALLIQDYDVLVGGILGGKRID